MRTFDIRYENGRFFDKIFGKWLESLQSKKKMKNKKLAFS